MVDKPVLRESSNIDSPSGTGGNTTDRNDGSYAIPPLFPSTELTSYHPSALNEPIARTDFSISDLESRSKSELVDIILDYQHKLESWRCAASDFLSAVALSPEMTDTVYARTLRELLTNALESLDSIDALKHVLCSMPSIRKEAPVVNLLKWTGLEFSEWDVAWAPSSWWVSLSADGSRWGLPFNCLARVSDIQLQGRMQCSLSKDITALRIKFSFPPQITMNVATSVGLGVVPVPVQESIAELIRTQVKMFVESRLCCDEGMVIVLRRKAVTSITENDISEAVAQARSASSVTLKGTTLF